MSNTRLVLAGILLPAVGIFMLFATFKGQRENDRLDADGMSVTGQVVGGEESRRRRGGRSYKLDVTYASPDGRVRNEKQFSVPKEIYEQSAVGGEVPVTFLMADPGVARVGERRDSAFGFIVGPILVLVGAGILAYLIRRRTRDRAAQSQPGPAGAATWSPPPPPPPPHH